MSTISAINTSQGQTISDYNRLPESQDLIVRLRNDKTKYEDEIAALQDGSESSGNRGYLQQELDKVEDRLDQIAIQKAEPQAATQEQPAAAPDAEMNARFGTAYEAQLSPAAQKSMAAAAATGETAMLPAIM